MKTKSVLATLLLGVAVLTSCSGLPKAAKSDDMKAWVFGHCLSNQLGNEYKQNYVLSLEEQGEGLNIVPDAYASHIMVGYFGVRYHYYAKEKEFLAKYGQVTHRVYDDEEFWAKELNNKAGAAQYAFNYDSDASYWTPQVGQAHEDLIKNMSDAEFKKGMLKIYHGFLDYLKQESLQYVEVMDYSYSDFGDSFTKYDIIYSVGLDFYAQVSFIDMGKRYEYTLEKTATSLNEILN